MTVFTKWPLTTSYLIALAYADTAVKLDTEMVSHWIAAGADETKPEVKLAWTVGEDRTFTPREAAETLLCALVRRNMVLND